MSLRVFAAALVLPLVLQNPSSLTPEERTRMEAQNAELRTLLQNGTKLPFDAAPIAVQAPVQDGWAMGMVSWVAADRNGLIYLLQRGDKADPVIVVDRAGKVVRSWGKGLYTTPHAIRVDPQGNVWTTDAASSMVYKFSPEGKTLLQIEVGGQPTPCGNFCSTTDIAFAPTGTSSSPTAIATRASSSTRPTARSCASGGARAPAPDSSACRTRSRSTTSGSRLRRRSRERPHPALRSREGKYLGEWSQYGKTFGLKLVGDAMWLSSIPRGPNGAPGWLIKVDRASGKLLGYVDAAGNHGMDVMANGDLLQAPGPDQKPQVYRSK